MIWKWMSLINMMFYLGREASKLWKKICMETFLELQLLAEKWKFLLAGLVFQYIHGLAARGVHYLHRPGPVLRDLGFDILPELGVQRAYLSETLFSVIFFSFLLRSCFIFLNLIAHWVGSISYLILVLLEILTFWSFHPFVYHSKRFYTILLWLRVLACLVVCQTLRIFTFYSTILPGPNYHCREGSPLAILPHPDSIFEVLLLNFPRGVLYGCGDLIFSSHMIFTLVFVRTYHKYGSNRFMKMLAWLLVIAQSLLIIAARKHYSVDVVVAWYTVNLVVFFVDAKLPETPDRSSGGSQPIIPLSSKEKESKAKEENHKLLNGDVADRRQRTQTNGKHMENGNNHHAHAEATMNAV